MRLSWHSNLLALDNDNRFWLCALFCFFSFSFSLYSLFHYTDSVARIHSTFFSRQFSFLPTFSTESILHRFHYYLFENNVAQWFIPFDPLTAVGQHRLTQNGLWVELVSVVSLTLLNLYFVLLNLFHLSAFFLVFVSLVSCPIRINAHNKSSDIDYMSWVCSWKALCTS